MRKSHPFRSGELTLHHRAGGAGSPITCGVKQGCITTVVEDVACPKCLEVLAASATADFIQAQAKVIADASRNLDTALFVACPGPHLCRQHRDGKPPWCKACGYTSAGSQVVAVTRPQSAPLAGCALCGQPLADDNCPDVCACDTAP